MGTVGEASGGNIWASMNGLAGDWGQSLVLFGRRGFGHGRVTVCGVWPQGGALKLLWTRPSVGPSNEGGGHGHEAQAV